MARIPHAIREASVAFDQWADALQESADAMRSMATELRGIIARISELPDQAILEREAAARPRRGRVATVKETTATILREAAGEALHADTVLAEVRRRGYSLSERDPKATIVTALIRLARERDRGNSGEGVERLGVNYYRWVTSWDVPPPIAQPQPLGRSQTAPLQ